MTHYFFAYLLILNGLLSASWVLLWPHQPLWLAAIATTLVVLIIRALWVYKRRQQVLLQSLTDGLLSLQDGDFATTLPEPAVARAKPIIELFNKAAAKLRQERQYLYQRELLLDKVINASSTLTVLVNDRDQVVFTNQPARLFFFGTDKLTESDCWLQRLQQRAPELQHIAEAEQGCFVSMLDNDQLPQAWHLSRSQLRLHGQRHELYIFKPMTDELNRQELQTWKKVVRVINHELNNSLAPISSMCHSGKLLSAKLEEPRLDKVFSTISRRISHLSEFIRDYSSLARISEPQKVTVQPVEMLTNLQSIYKFELHTENELPAIQADPNQLEQVFINILKNAHEAAPDGDICVTMSQLSADFLQISFADQGPGMSQETLAKALTPGFSSKTNGSGIGLALCREVMDAHQGRLTLRNGPEQGLIVQLSLPLSSGDSIAVGDSTH